MPPQKPLDEAVEEILDAMADAIEAGVDAGLPLDGIKSVVRGDRARPMPPLPSIWIVPESADVDHTTHGLAELHFMPVTISALVKSDDPEEGGRLSFRYAARARSEVLKNRDLGLNFVRDVVTTRFDAATRRIEQNRNLYWSDVTVTVSFSVVE